MSAVSNTFQTYGAVGIREDLSDIIYNISPTQTPFMSNAQRGKADNTFFEWQTDSLATASTSNQQLEGDDITTFDAEDATVRLGNYTQISRKTLIVSDTEETVNKAGRKSELSYQLAKKGKELKRDMEANLLANLAANAGSSSTARVTGSLLSFIKTNVNKAANGVIPVYTNVPTDVYTSGTARAFTETILKDVIQQCWAQGAEPKVIMLGALGKQAFSAMAGVAAKRMNQSGADMTAIIGAADAYVSDFGTLTAVPNRFQRIGDAFVLDFDFIEVDYLRPFKQVPLAKTGDAEKRMLIVEYGLRVKNEKAEGLATDLTP